MSAANEINPIRWGWKIDNELVLITSHVNVAPNIVLKIIQLINY